MIEKHLPKPLLVKEGLLYFLPLLRGGQVGLFSGMLSALPPTS